jgi:hypothetical protein
VQARAETLPLEAIAAAAADSGVRIDPVLVAAALGREAREHAARVDLETRERRRIDELGLPTFTLPVIPDGIDLGALYELALQLRSEGVR